MIYFHNKFLDIKPFGYFDDNKIKTSAVFPIQIHGNKKYFNRNGLYCYGTQTYRVEYTTPWTDSNGNLHVFVEEKSKNNSDYFSSNNHYPEWQSKFNLTFYCYLTDLQDDDTEEIELMSPEEWAQLMKYGPGYYNKYGRKCECGSEKVYGDKATHSHWCPKYESNT